MNSKSKIETAFEIISNRLSSQIIESSINISNSQKDMINNLTINGKKLKKPLKNSIIGGEEISLADTAQINLNNENLILLNENEIKFHLDINKDKFFQPISNKLEIHMVD